MTPQEQSEAARQFYYRWRGKGQEDQHTAQFWIDLLQSVFGVTNLDYIDFEKRVYGEDGNKKRIDGYISETKVLIEQKSIDIALDKPQIGHHGDTPYQQAWRYNNGLPVDEKAKYIITSNFKEIWIYDMSKMQPEKEVQKISLEDIPSEIYRIEFLVKKEAAKITKEVTVSKQAGEIVGVLYDELYKNYAEPNDETLKSLNKLCVRLVFCMYAEDAGLFGKKDMFHDYLINVEPKKIRRALKDLFRILDTPESKRDPDEDEDLLQFPYVNGGLFSSDEDIAIPQFTEELKEILLQKASNDFDWSEISPTIFGAVFESTLNPETRRSGGMHYTSIENIHKVIDPLFLDGLKNELKEIVDENAILLKIYKDNIERISQKYGKEADRQGIGELTVSMSRSMSSEKSAEKRKVNASIKQSLYKLDKLQEKIASLKFLDPACGSGNFLTETFLSIRRLENDIILFRQQINNDDTEGQMTFLNPIKVSIDQFYGIEINDFAVTVAKTALWIAESQMIKETEKIINLPIDFLPLKTNAYIVEGNALRIDWNDVLLSSECSYIMGNPPFRGARFMDEQQKSDVNRVFVNWKNAGNLDYVSCWYKKATDYMKNTNTRAALVSTNSVSQGDSVAILWKPLFNSGIHINFAYRTFVWDSEAKLKAKVHCVIIGFSFVNDIKKQIIYNAGESQYVNNINAYLIDAENIFVESRNKPLCDVPEIGIGNKPVDGGFYLFEEDEMKDFIKREPVSAQYFHPWYGAREFINRCPRYCLYLGNCTPAELRKMPECIKLVESVRDYRLHSPSAGTRKIAETPTKFHVTNMPQGSYIVIPQVSSERRRYIPMGYMDDGVLCSDKVRIMPEGKLYHLGILTSNVHMAWMRTICCRLKSDYSYTVNDVYNNFPWPSPTDEQRKIIENTAQAILDARALYPDSSLADLYDPLLMPKELRDAHTKNDIAVMKAYGFNIKETSEADCVAQLMKMYKELTENG